MRANDGVFAEGMHTGSERFLVLRTVGAKSGKPRETLLFYLKADDCWRLVGSFWGNEKHPAWAYNLRANPKVKVEVDNQTLDVTARELVGAERDEIWSRVVETAPVFGEYQEKTDRLITLFELVRRAR